MTRVVEINGEEAKVSAETLKDLLVERGVNPEVPGIAVAVDGEVVPRRSWSDAPVRDGARVEIVKPFSGG